MQCCVWAQAEQVECSWPQAFWVHLVQEQAAKAADVAAEVEQEAASLRAASNSAQEDSLAAAAALARLGEDLRKSEVSRDVQPNRIRDTCCEAAFNTLCCLRGPWKEQGQS